MKRPFRRPLARGSAEFYLRQPENLLLVRGTADGGVLVCATADNLSTAEQEAFIEYLCAEGFLTAAGRPPDQALDRMPGHDEPSVRWIVDPSWPEVDPGYALHIQRLARYTAGSLIVFLALVAVMICW